MNKRREYGTAIAASVGSDRGAPALAGKHTLYAEQQPGDGQHGERAGEQPGERAQKQARNKPDGGLEKSSQQDRESGVAPGAQPAGVERDIGSRMPDRK